jgi:hypothetical protein
MAKKKELIEEPTEVVVPAVEETVVEEAPAVLEAWDGHKTRIYRAGQI